MSLLSNIKPGVVTGDGVQEIFKLAKEKQFALPAVNCINTSTVNAVLEAAAQVKAPVIIQFSNGGAQFLQVKEWEIKIKKVLFWAEYLELNMCT